jgi:ABC-type multidrug transport system fused ATPase/permease subunit
MIYGLFYEFFKKHILQTIFYMITMVHIPLNTLGMPHLYGKLISNLKDSSINNGIYFMILLILMWSAIQFIRLLAGYMYSRIFPKFGSFVRGRLVEIIIQRYKTNYQDLEIGDTITKIIKTPWLLEDMFNIGEDFVFRNILIFVSSFVYLSMYSIKLGLIYVFSIFIVFLMCIVYVKKCRKYTVKSEQIYDNVHEEIEDILSNLISVYTAQKTEYEKVKLDKINTKVYKSQQAINKCNNKYKVFFAIIYICIFIVLNFYAIHIFKKKEINLERLIAIIIINYSLLTSLMTIYFYAKRLASILGRKKVFFEYINKLPHSSKDNKLKINTMKSLHISIKNLDFHYVKGSPILNNINLEINNNDVIGLIGPIGSGKSTIGKLLVRLQNPKSGSIFLNKINIKNLNVDNLRHIINYIPQHPKLFNRTLFNNIVYGITKKIDENDIYKILEDLDVNKTTEKFKSIMFKKVGKNGSKLSGGQRQLVWLIRAILKNSKVIILDEPTSSLDNKSKLQVIKFIKKYSKNKTIILITHDKSLLKYVDRIITIKNGNIIKDKKKTQ